MKRTMKVKAATQHGLDVEIIIKVNTKGNYSRNGTNAIIEDLADSAMHSLTGARHLAGMIKLCNIKVS